MGINVITMTKQEVRKYISEQKKLRTPEELYKKSMTVIKKIFELSEYKECDNVLCFVSYNKEVDTKYFIAEAIKHGKDVYVPKVTGKDMDFYKISGLSELSPGAYGIPEPDGSYQDKYTDATAGKTIMIMPGVAFDRSNNRTGYGGGYYDRYLKDRKTIFKAAVCYDFQLVDKLYTEGHDIKPDVVLVSD